MIIANESERPPGWRCWCPNTATVRTAPLVLRRPPVTVYHQEPDGGAGGSGRRIVRGIGLAVGSIKILIRKKWLLWFSFLTGLVVLFMIAAELYLITHLDLFALFSVGIPFMNLFLVFDIRFFFVQAISLFGIYFLLAGLVLSLSQTCAGQPATLREGLSKARIYASSLATWSVIMAVLGTFLYAFFIQDKFFGSLRMTVDMSAFFIPYVYYIPDSIGAALYFVFYAMLINVFLFILTLFVVPGVVLGNKSLPRAVAGSIPLFRKTWGEIIGSSLFFGLIALGIFLISVIICLSPVFVNHDYDFFLSRGRLLMTAICFLYIIGGWIMAIIGSTAVGISLAGLYTYARTGRMPDVFDDLTPTGACEGPSSGKNTHGIQRMEKENRL